MISNGTILGMARPRETPIGLQLATTAKAVGRAFNDALVEVGGSLPTWLVLRSLKAGQPETQLELARQIGIEGPTLTRHLDGLERDGLIRRRRAAGDRRAVRVEVTAAGDTLHDELLKAVIAFDRQLTAGMSEQELSRLRQSLERLEKRFRPSLD
jgi:MarR family transcriptional regulator for hemolysin